MSQELQHRAQMHGPRHGHCRSPGLDLTIAPCGSTGHPALHVPNGSTALRHQRSPRWLPRPQESSWPSWPSWQQETDINTDPGSSRAMVTDMAPSCSPGLDATKALDSSLCHLDLYGPRCIMVPGLQYGPRCPIRPWEPHDPWLQQEPQMSIQILAPVGPQGSQQFRPPGYHYDPGNFIFFLNK